jgi:hypothetical protein
MRCGHQLPDPFYYLNNFQTVLASIDRQYGELLTPEERRFIDHFRALPRVSGAVLVRMVMRQGCLFRRSRMRYPEIGETAAAVAPLLQAGWVDDSPDLDVPQLQKLLTKAELFHYFPGLRPYQALKKPDLVAVLGAQHPGSKPFLEWCEGSGDGVYRLAVDALCGVASFLLPKVTVGFPGNYRASCQFPLLKQDVATPDF